MSNKLDKQLTALSNELYRKVECALGDAWISDEPGLGARDVAEFESFVRVRLAASREASKIITTFLRKHRKTFEAARQGG